MNKLVTVKNLSKSFGKVKAVDNVSFDILENEFLVIMGKSGSGKSTLLSLLSGLEKGDFGEVDFNGSLISSMDEEELALFRRHNVGIVFQSFNLIASLNVVENVAFPLFPEKISRDEILSRGRDLAEKVGLGHRLGHYPSELSGGEKQRVAIARALINNPTVVFADEPTGNLDSKTGEDIIAYLKKLNMDQNLTVVLVTHDVSISEAADRVIELKDGVII